MSTLSTTNLKNPSSGSNNIVLNANGSTAITTLSSTTLTSTDITGTDITGTTIQGTIKQGTVSGPHPLSPAATSIDFTSIPSWVKKITVMFDGVSTNGSSIVQVQIGSSSFTTSGYLSGTADDLSSRTSLTTGFAIQSVSALNLIYLSMVIRLVSGNTWLSTHSGTFNQNGSYYSVSGGGNVTLSGALDRVRITTVNGTDEFDAGSINIMYEG